VRVHRGTVLQDIRLIRGCSARSDMNLLVGSGLRSARIMIDVLLRQCSAMCEDGGSVLRDTNESLLRQCSAKCEDYD
jgi:hypothetical protein